MVPGGLQAIHVSVRNTKRRNLS